MNFKWIKPNIIAYIQSIVLFPVKVKIIEVNNEKQLAYIQSSEQAGWVRFDQLYETLELCPVR